MYYLLALAALAIAYITGEPKISLWMETGSHQHMLSAIQGLAHGLTMVALAGVALTFSKDKKWGALLIFVGSIGVLGGLTEDILNITRQGGGWEKDLTDAAQRFALLTLFTLRLDRVF